MSNSDSGTIFSAANPEKTKGPQKEDERSLAEDEWISEEERGEILKQIDKAVLDRRISDNSKLFALNPKKKGIFYPLAVNIASFVVVALVLILTSIYFGVRQDKMTQESALYLSAEGKILEEFKRESAEKLKEKDAAIARITTRLEALDRERENLKRSIETGMKDKEEELRRILEEDLESEKARLTALGTSARDIEDKIEDFKKMKEQEYKLALEAYQRELEASLKEKEEALLKEREETKEIIERANQERENFLAETKKREEELKLSYAREKEALQSKASLAEKELKAITELREKERLFTDQIFSSYEGIMEKIENADFREAAQDLEALREFLLNESIDSLPELNKRKKVELFVIDSLLEMIESRSSGEEAAEISPMIETATLLFSVRDTIVQADDLYARGKQAEAKKLYHRALKEIASLHDEAVSSSTIEINETGNDQGETPAQEEDIDDAIEEYKKFTRQIPTDNQELIIAALDILHESFEVQERKLLPEIARQSEEKVYQETLSESIKEPLSGTVVEAEDETENEAEDRALLVKSKLLGTLFSVSSKEVVIEPLVSLSVKEGTRVWISRRFPEGGEIQVALGTVYKVSDGRITAGIDKILSEGQRPMIMDLVYITVE